MRVCRGSQSGCCYHPLNFAHKSCQTAKSFDPSELEAKADSAWCYTTRQETFGSAYSVSSLLDHLPQKLAWPSDSSSEYDSCARYFASISWCCSSLSYSYVDLQPLDSKSCGSSIWLPRIVHSCRRQCYMSGDQARRLFDSALWWVCEHSSCSFRAWSTVEDSRISSSFEASSVPSEAYLIHSYSF